MADSALDVLVICGSLRKGSFNAALARALPEFAPSGLALRYAAPLGDIPPYNADVQDAGNPPSVVALTDAIRSADGLIIVSPEYNWSIPGVLKNAIDWVSKVKNQPFHGKPVALQSCATGLLGGSRMQYHLRQALTSIEAQILIRPEVFVTFAAKKFDDKTLELTDQPTKDMVKLQLEAYEKFLGRCTAKH